MTPDISDNAAILECVIPGRVGIYASAPITSGRRSVELQRSQGRVPRSEDVQRLVIEPNLHDARAFALRLRERFGGRVIDPSRLPLLEGWEQSDYYRLWGDVVQNRTEIAVFLDGWEYSAGCRNEFEVAAKSGVPACDSQLRPLSPKRGRELMRKVQESLRCEGQEVTSLASVVDLTGSAASAAKISKSHLCSLIIGCVADAGHALVCYSLPLDRADIWAQRTLNERVICDGDRSRWAEAQRRLVGIVRSSIRNAVIDTGAFAPPHWSRSELHQLWIEVTETYAEKLILPPHWRTVDNYLNVLQSVVRKGIRVTDEEGAPVESFFVTT